MSVHKPTAYGSPRSALLTVNAVAELLAISRDSVYRLVRRGELAPYRVGERLRFRPEDVDAYLESTRLPCPERSP